MMNATALVLATCEKKRSYIIDQLSATQLFSQVTPVTSASSLLQQLKNRSADLVCWGISQAEKQAHWIDRLHGNEEWHDLPLIAFADNQESLINSFTLGVSDAVKSTINPKELGARLKGHLQRWQRLNELRQTKERLEKLALTDPLTGLGNRATFDLNVKQAAARSLRSATPFSLLMIDLDHFKKFNDCYGHQAGDDVLQQVAKAISASARDADICCRYGGEEFAVILPDTESRNARILAERIHRKVAQTSKKLRHFQMPLTVSIGISCTLQSGQFDPQQIIKEADQALYLAKSNGRNRTETWRRVARAKSSYDFPVFAPLSQQLACGA